MFLRNNKPGRGVIKAISAIAIFIMLFGLIASCGKAPTKVETTPTQTMPSRTPAPTVELAPTRDRAIYLTPEPTQFPSDVQIPIQTSYNLPAWMSDPHTAILLDLTIKKDAQYSSWTLAFLNAATGEWYYLPFPSDAQTYFWLDSMHFGLLSKDLQTMYLIDVKSGQVTSILIPQSSTSGLKLSALIQPIQVNRGSKVGEYLFENSLDYSRRFASATSHYRANSDSNQESRPITVTEVNTGQVILQLNPLPGWLNNYYAWSPVDESYLAVVEGQPDQTVDFWFPVKNTTLRVYDVTTAQIISSIKADIGSFVWSPDGNRILSQDAISLYWNFGYGFRKAPCIFNVQTGENKCITRIIDRPTPAGYVLGTSTDYQWSPDGKSISFVYEYDSPSEMKGTVCIYNLLDGNFNCPTDRLSRLPEWSGNFWLGGWNINYYDISPDRQYLHFCFSSDSLHSDSQGGPSNDGLIRMDGQGLIYWFDEVNGDYPKSQCSYSGSIWRPLP